MSAPAFVQPPTSRFALGCGALFFGPLVVGFSIAAWSELGPPFVAIPVVLGLALLAAVYWIFSEEVRVTIDERVMRLSRVRVILGVRLAERTDWELALDRLTKALEVTTRTPARNGGWDRRTVLQLPEGRAIDATLLGGDESSGTTYLALTAWLRQRLGAAFEHRDVV